MGGRDGAAASPGIEWLVSLAAGKNPARRIGLGGAVLESKMLSLRLASMLALAGLAAAARPAAAEPRAVIELFTSQGCSSCPAADKLLGDLSRDPSLVTMSLPVDYWDYLGWKDTLALNGHTSRERAYAKARGDREVYTPQVVVNGMMHALGSDKAAIERAILQTRQHSAALSLPVNVSITGNTVNVDVPAAKDAHAAAEVWLCPLAGSVSVPVGRGENHGRTLTYTNVVRRWVKLGDWTGKAQSYTVPLKDLQGGDIDRLAVMVQAGMASAPKVMLGAAEVPIR
jgi:hypothetical protein